MAELEQQPREPVGDGEPETVDALHAGLGGRWLVTSQGSRHVWDLDAMTYRRLPGPGRKSFDYDGQQCPIDRIEVWPAVGRSSLVFFDDPNVPGVEQWRICSTIRTISRLDADTEP